MYGDFVYESIYRTVKSALIESVENFDGLFSANNGSNITEYVIKYLSWSVIGERNPLFSKEASKLHDGLMGTLCLFHENEEDRRIFADIIRYLRILNKRMGIKSVVVSTSDTWDVEFNGGQSNEVINQIDYISIDPREFKYQNNSRNLLWTSVVFETHDGIENRDYDYRSGSWNGSSGYYTSQAEMTKEMKQKIYAMGLVPALRVTGSYHENFIYSVGVLPDMVSKIKKVGEDEMGLYFDCKFSEKC